MRLEQGLPPTKQTLTFLYRGRGHVDTGAVILGVHNALVRIVRVWSLACLWLNVRVDVCVE